MEARNNWARFNSSDVFNTKSGEANGHSTLYDPHPYLKDRVNSDNRTRTSFQDSNIFGYKEGENVTWQGTGRADRAAGIKAGTYHLSSHTPGHTLYNPEAGMSMHQTHTKQTYVEPTKDLYTHNDPTIPKSRLGEEVFGVKEFDRAAAKQDLLPQDAFWLRHVDKTKNTEDVVALSPEERRIKEVYGTHEGAKIGHGDLKHATLADWRNPHASDKRSNYVQDVNTFEQRAKELSSLQNPLATTDYSEYTPKTKEQAVLEDVDKRVKDAMYSDLYGQTGKYGPKPITNRHSEISSHSGIFSKEGAQKGFRWDDETTPAERRQDFLRASGFPSAYDNYSVGKTYPKNSEINQARAQLRMPKVIKGCELESAALHTEDFYEKYNVIKDHRETNVISLRFKNLTKETDAESLKAIAGVKHVVRAAVQTDNIKNECTGQGEITIRLSDNETKEDIVGRFEAAGIITEDKPDDAGKRKSNYADLASTGWRDSRLEFEEKRHVNTGYENTRISKIQQLNSNIGMGTNNALVDYGQQFADVVRSGRDNLFAAQRVAEDEKQLLTTWDSMRPMTAAPARSGTYGASVMKPTQSFSIKSKHVQDSIRNRGYY